MTDQFTAFAAFAFVYFIMCYAGAMMIADIRMQKAQYAEFMKGPKSTDPKILVGEFQMLDAKYNRLAKSHIRLRQRFDDSLLLPRPTLAEVVARDEARREKRKKQVERTI